MCKRVTYSVCVSLVNESFVNHTVRRILFCSYLCNSLTILPSSPPDRNPQQQHIRRDHARACCGGIVGQLGGCGEEPRHLPRADHRGARGIARCGCGEVAREHGLYDSCKGFGTQRFYFLSSPITPSLIIFLSLFFAICSCSCSCSCR